MPSMFSAKCARHYTAFGLLTAEVAILNPVNPFPQSLKRDLKKNCSKTKIDHQTNNRPGCTTNQVPAYRK